MQKVPSEAVVDVWIALMRAQQSALRWVERAFRDAQLPPLIWYDVLWELDRASDAGLRPYQIEERMLISQSNISRLLDKLEAKGLVRRLTCEDDKRGQFVQITEAGRALRRTMWQVYAEAINHAVGRHLSDEEATALSTLLTRLSLNPS